MEPSLNVIFNNLATFPPILPQVSTTSQQTCFFAVIYKNPTQSRGNIFQVSIVLGDIVSLIKKKVIISALNARRVLEKSCCDLANKGVVGF
jgi:hypothetical protein